MGEAGWNIVEAAGLRIARCGLLELPGVAHAFSTREIDLGAADSEEPAILQSRRQLCAAAGLHGKTPRVLRQVHGDLVLPIEGSRDGQKADGLFAVVGPPSSAVPAVRVADCVPVLLAEEGGRALAAVHAGWRGTAAEIVLRAVDRFEEQGFTPSGLRAALGPAIGSCCYEVGPEVVREVARGAGVGESDVAQERTAGRLFLDLRRALRFQLESVGVDPGAISEAPWCTRCHRELFFSYRREGSGAGRMMALIGWGSLA